MTAPSTAVPGTSPPDFEVPPDHTQLPCSDGAIVENFQELPQSILLTSSIWPVLEALHPDGQFCVGQNSGIYWRNTHPPLQGCKAPDWFYVPNVPQMVVDGVRRRSYVLWNEGVAPVIVLEFVSGDGTEERDRTPKTGKFWVYEQGIRVPYYGLFEIEGEVLEVYHLVDGRYRPLTPNQRGHFDIPPMGVELGIWKGIMHGMDLPWLRWWDGQGNLLPSADERAAAEQQRAEAETQRADNAEEKNRRLAERLRALGGDPESP